MQRVFIGLKVNPGDLLMRISGSLRALLGNEKITWVDPANIHLTLAFLGNTEEELIKAVSIMLKKTCTGFGDFKFNLTGTGIFRNFNDPKVIWIGIEPDEKLLHLNNLIMTVLKDAGFRLEERPFRPHLTLGRIKFIKDVNALKSALEKYYDIPIQQVHVEEVILYESILKPTGPIYKPIGIFKL